MPTGIDCSGMVYAVKDADGTWKQIQSPIQSVEVVADTNDDTNFRYTLESLMPQKIQFELECRMRFVHGMMHCILGHTWTKPAWRYIRHTKRVKEKERRKRLKEGGKTV